MLKGLYNLVLFIIYLVLSIIYLVSSNKTLFLSYLFKD